MELHHSVHHQTYVGNLNKALKSYAEAVTSEDIAKQISLQSAIKFNGGGHINHCLFWENLSPASSPDAAIQSAPTLMEAINKTWGSLDNFKGAFKNTLLGIQGSGWGWLVKDSHGLRIITTKDQDPVVGGEVPIFGIDMWEHAYYLQVSDAQKQSPEAILAADPCTRMQYLSGKAKYLDNIWSIINWKTAEARFQGTAEDAFKLLRASL